MTDTVQVKQVKRSDPEIRALMLERGAMFFDFQTSVTPTKEYKEWFEAMQKLGFLVSTTGCIFPYENYSTGSKGRPKGHKISAGFFLGPAPTFDEHRHGWPVTTQVSHLCHRAKCINPAHILYEPQWKNLKRNFCGDTDVCDCGLTPKCLLVYHNDEWIYNDSFITYETKGYKQLVSVCLPNHRYTIRPSNYYQKEDTKRTKRNKKKNTEKKRKAEAEAPSPPPHKK